MKIDTLPAKEKIVNPESFGTWQWLKWFEAVRKIISFFLAERLVSSVSVNTILTDLHGTVVVTADGLTITLPAASIARIGRVWTIVFATTGTCIVQCAGSDTFPAVKSATETSLVMVSRGSSVVFQCTSATTWGVM